VLVRHVDLDAAKLGVGEKHVVLNRVVLMAVLMQRFVIQLLGPGRLRRLLDSGRLQDERQSEVTREPRQRPNEPGGADAVELEFLSLPRVDTKVLADDGDNLADVLVL
jgi:hypothetical protein